MSDVGMSPLPQVANIPIMRSEAEIQSAIFSPVLCMRLVEKLFLADIFVPNLFLCNVFFLAGALAVISKRNSPGSEGQQAANTALRGLDVPPLPPYLLETWVRQGSAFLHIILP